MGMIIDPIDGTVNFAHGSSYWCSSVAVRHQGEIVAGAVYAPVLDQLYTASREHPLASMTALFSPLRCKK